MSKRTKIDPAVLAAEQEAKAARQKAKDTRSLIIRICAAVLILAAAAVICYFMMIHDFNPDRHTLHGTYIAEQSYIYATESGTDTSNERVFPVVFCEDGRMLYKYAASTKTHYYNYAEMIPIYATLLSASIITAALPEKSMWFTAKTAILQCTAPTIPSI